MPRSGDDGSHGRGGLRRCWDDILEVLREHDASADEAALAALPFVVELDGLVAAQLGSG
jgi:hypothetical protein